MTEAKVWQSVLSRAHEGKLGSGLPLAGENSVLYRSELLYDAWLEECEQRGIRPEGTREEQWERLLQTPARCFIVQETVPVTPSGDTKYCEIMRRGLKRPLEEEESREVKRARRLLKKHGFLGCTTSFNEQDTLTILRLYVDELPAMNRAYYREFPGLTTVRYFGQQGSVHTVVPEPGVRTLALVHATDYSFVGVAPATEGAPKLPFREVAPARDE